MIWWNKEKRFAHLIASGDKCLQRGHAACALHKYRKALALNDQDAALYGKLIAAHQAAQGDAEWTQDDLALSLDWEMKKQALENPAVRDTHERLTPEWQAITELIEQWWSCEDAERRTQLLTEIRSHEQRAVLPLLDFLTRLQSASS